MFVPYTIIPWEAWAYVAEGNLGEWTYIFFYPAHYQMPFSVILTFNPIAAYMEVPGSHTPWLLRMMDAKLSSGWDVL